MNSLFADTILGDRPRGLFENALSDIFTGPADPRLTQQQNEQARRQALIQGGLATLASGDHNSFAAIAKGAMAGQDARAQFAQQQAGLEAQQKFAELMQSGATPQQIFAHALSTGNTGLATAIVSYMNTQNPTVVPAGGAVYQGGRLIANNPKSMLDELPAEARVAALALGIDPEHMTEQEKQAFVAKYKDLKKSGAQSINVALPGPQSTKGVTASQIALYDDINTAAAGAQNRLQSLNAMEALLDAGAVTGKMEELTKPWREIAAAFGIGNVDKLSLQQVLVSLSNKLALESKTGLSGPMSDKDIVFLKEQVPRLANTVEGNRILIHVMRRMAKYQIELADEAENYYENKGDLIGWRRHAAAWGESHPIDLTDLRKMISVPRPTRR